MFHGMDGAAERLARKVAGEVPGNVGALAALA